MKINDGRVVSNFINQALSNKEITIYGSGKQERSFCYIDDLIRGIISLMKTNKNISFPINLGHTKSISIKNLSKTINKMIDSKSELVFKDLPLDDPKKRKPDITLAKKHLGWSPKIDLNEGLKKTILYFKNN
jgi:UDP-glucuronate decarboxylase